MDVAHGAPPLLTDLAIVLGTAAVVSALFAPLYHAMFWEMGEITLAIGLMSLLLLWRHGENIGKLLAGKESRIGQKKKP